jgi:hypothetical protein
MLTKQFALLAVFAGTVFLSLFASGCSSTQVSRFHVAVADVNDPNPKVKFYRITIQAKASNVHATLQSGFYDANAVRQLYGEVRNSGTDSPTSDQVGVHQYVYNSFAKVWEPLEDKELFTVVYGVDAKAIASEIQAFAASDQAGTQFARLLAGASIGDTYNTVLAAEQKEAKARANVNALADALAAKKDSLDKLDQNGNPGDWSKLLLEAAQEVAKQLGSSTVFRSTPTDGFKDAERFYENLNHSSQ